MPNCRRLFTQAARREASRAAWIAGSSNDTKMPMIAITTSNSTSVKPRRMIPFLKLPITISIIVAGGVNTAQLEEAGGGVMLRPSPLQGEREQTLER